MRPQLSILLAAAAIALVRSQDAPAAPSIDPALDVYAAPQHLVQLIDGRRMNVLCLGSGSPTVILEAGAGGSTLEWRWIQRDVAKATRTCAYDRAGMGFSDSGPLPRTADSVVRDFIALTKAAGLRPPYILVAHSIGSFYVRLYADRFPADVAGMVLVDPSVEYQDQRFIAVSRPFAELLRKDEASARRCLRLARAGTLIAASSAFKDCSYGYSRDPTFSDALFDVQIRRRLSVAFRATLLSETDEMDGADSDELSAARRSYGAMPLIILTQSPETPEAYPGMSAEQVQGMNALWMHMHDELAQLSSDGVNRPVERSGHYIQRDRPDVVTAAIAEVLRAIRGGKR